MYSHMDSDRSEGGRLLAGLQSRRMEMENVISSLRRRYNRHEPISPDELRALQTTIHDYLRDEESLGEVQQRIVERRRAELEQLTRILQETYDQHEPISSEELQELEAAITDNFWQEFPELAYAAKQKARQGAEWGMVQVVTFRISEEPLMLQTIATALFTLNELATKYWLISRGRFADLVEYAQVRDSRFAEEAHVIVEKITHNSPANFDVKFDASATNIAKAVVSTIDGVMQARVRLTKATLENQAKALEIRQVEQKSEQEDQTALLEREKQRLDIEKRRLELLEKQLDVQKKSVEYALELAGKIVDMLRPGVDADVRAMAIQTLLPNILQQQNVKGLEIVLPAPQLDAGQQ